MKTKQQEPTPEQIEEMGGNLHTALRKCCESSPTSAAWNIIHVLDQKTWRSFLAAMVGSKTGADLKDRFETWADKTAWTIEAALSKEEKHEARSISVTFRCILHCFTDDDWNGFAGFLEE